VLEPRGGGERLSGPCFFGEKRWVTGSYELSVTVSGDRGPLMSSTFTLTPSGFRVEVPEKVPDGMVFIPASGPVHRPYFIDRYEVTVAEFKRFRVGYDPYYPAPRNPAHGVSFEDAMAYAGSVNKMLPTRDQWIRAAFGDSGYGYDGGNSNLTKGEPEPVGTRPAGPFGIFDMGGNVSEWLRDGWALGASFDNGRIAKTLGGKPRNFLHDPRPGPAAYNRMSGEPRRTYSPYKLHPEDDNLIEVGLRCVIELNP
jgi:formylglycine-generating enzyme required for sulfatase activity